MLRMLTVVLNARRLRVTHIRRMPPVLRWTPTACRLRWPDVRRMAPILVRFLSAGRLRVGSLPTPCLKWMDAGRFTIGQLSDRSLRWLGDDVLVEGHVHGAH